MVAATSILANMLSRSIHKYFFLNTVRTLDLPRPSEAVRGRIGRRTCDAPRRRFLENEGRIHGLCSAFKLNGPPQTHDVEGVDDLAPSF